MKAVLLILSTAVGGGLAVDLHYSALGFTLLSISFISVLTFPILAEILSD